MHFLGRPAPLVTTFAITFALIAPLAGAAQDDPNSASIAADGVGVARISLVEGRVAVQRGDSSDSLTAVPNAPILGGDYVTTGDSSRTEIQLDGYSQVRLGQDVQMRFRHLDTRNRSIQLAAGTLDLRLLHGPDGSSSIDTPSITIKPQRSGSYRVTVTSDGRTLVTVRSGDAQIDTPQASRDLQPGTTLIAQGEAADPSIQTEAAVALDDFDRFNADRDRAHEPALADAAFVNPDIGGVEDLDANGHWVTDGSYGHVWVPGSVGPDWAPYRAGRWVWEEGYGWTWIANEPWGWAPYHYGSWYNSPNYGWCWYPPQRRAYVPWRPALVAFIGFGAGSGFGLSFGGGNAFENIGWVPLAPFEPYHPWWGNRYGYGGGTVINNVTNITNVTNVTNINVFKNVQYNAVSSVSSQRFLQGNFTHNIAVTAPQLQRAHVFRGALPVVPTASNLRFTSSNAASAVAVRPALMQHSFAGNPVVIRRTPFTTQRMALAAATHAAITPLHFKDAQTTPLVPIRAVEHAPPQGVRTDAVPAHRAAAAGAANAWNRFNQTRPPENTSKRINTPAGRDVHRSAPTMINERTQPGSTIAPAPPTLRNSRTAPFNTGYHAPIRPATYRTPSGIQRPTKEQQNDPSYASHPSTSHPSTSHPSTSHPSHVAQPRTDIGSQRSAGSRNAAKSPHETNAEAAVEHQAPSATHAAPAAKSDTPQKSHEPPHANLRG